MEFQLIKTIRSSQANNDVCDGHESALTSQWPKPIFLSLPIPSSTHKANNVLPQIALATSCERWPSVCICVCVEHMQTKSGKSMDGISIRGFTGGNGECVLLCVANTSFTWVTFLHMCGA